MAVLKEEQRSLDIQTNGFEKKKMELPSDENQSGNCVAGGDSAEESRKDADGDSSGNKISVNNRGSGGEIERNLGDANESFSEINVSDGHGDLNKESSGESVRSSLGKVEERTVASESMEAALQPNFSQLEIEKREDCVEESDNASCTDNSGKIQITEDENGESEGKLALVPVTNGNVQLVRPHSQLPKPEAPPGLFKSQSNGEDFHPIERSKSLSETFTVDMPAIGKFIRDRSNSIRDRSNSLSAAISKRFSSLTENEDRKSNDLNQPSISEFHLSGLKVIVQLKSTDEGRDLNLKGRISFFSRSNCRDCSAVRSFFRSRGLKFVEINIDVYPSREKELIQRTGNSSVPQIFFNEKLFGGLVALNSLRNSGEFDRRLKEMLGKRCPDDAPTPPVYGFDDAEDDCMDVMIGIVRVLRQRLPIQDRLMKMKIVKNCFSGSEMVEAIIQQLGCERNKAIEIGKELARKHFIHHVLRENDFEDGNHYYRFLEHAPFIPKCFNFRGSVNDYEPKSAASVNQRLTKIMAAILESYASEDRRHVNYFGISNSEEFRRYLNLVQELHRVNILELSTDEKLAFFLNLHNAMVIHALIRIGCPEGIVDRRTFYSDFQYLVGGYPYSLNTIKNGVLRSNRRSPYSWTKPFGAGDTRLEIALPKVNPLIHFGICNGTRSSPTVRFFSSQGIEAELRSAAREFFHGDGMEVDLNKRTVYLTKIIKWFDADFGSEKEILKWIMNYLDSTKAGLLTHLLSDGGPINIVYQKYDWSMNS